MELRKGLPIVRGLKKPPGSARVPSALAKTQAVPASVILPDRSLLEMARGKPTTLGETRRIRGIGKAKLKPCGEEFVEVSRRHSHFVLPT